MTNNSDNQAKLSLDYAKTNGHLLIKFDDNSDLFFKKVRYELNVQETVLSPL